jgi:hypothetical protein
MGYTSIQQISCGSSESVGATKLAVRLIANDLCTVAKSAVHSSLAAPNHHNLKKAFTQQQTLPILLICLTTSREARLLCHLTRTYSLLQGSSLTGIRLTQPAVCPQTSSHEAYAEGNVA